MPMAIGISDEAEQQQDRALGRDHPLSVDQRSTSTGQQQPVELASLSVPAAVVAHDSER